MKAISWSSRTVRLIVDYQAIYKQAKSGQFNLFLQMILIISFTFSFYDFLSFHHPQQQIQTH